MPDTMPLAKWNAWMPDNTSLAGDCAPHWLGAQDDDELDDDDMFDDEDDDDVFDDDDDDFDDDDDDDFFDDDDDDDEFDSLDDDED